MPGEFDDKPIGIRLILIILPFLPFWEKPLREEVPLDERLALNFSCMFFEFHSRIFSGVVHRESVQPRRRDALSLSSLRTPSYPSPPPLPSASSASCDLTAGIHHLVSELWPQDQGPSSGRKAAPPETLTRCRTGQRPWPEVLMNLDGRKTRRKHSSSSS